MIELTSSFVVVALTAFFFGMVIGAIAFLTIAVALLERATRSISVAVPSGRVEQPRDELLRGLQELAGGTPLAADLPVVELPPASAAPAPGRSRWRFESQDWVPRSKRCRACETLRAWFARTQRPSGPVGGS